MTRKQTDYVAEARRLLSLMDLDLDGTADTEIYRQQRMDAEAGILAMVESFQRGLRQRELLERLPLPPWAEERLEQYDRNHEQWLKSTDALREALRQREAEYLQACADLDEARAELRGGRVDVWNAAINALLAARDAETAR